MAFIPLTDEEKRILQNGGAGETEPPEESAGGLFGGKNVSSIPQVASARDRLTDLRTEAVDAEADLSPAPAADLDSLARSGGIDLSPYEDEPFRGEERLNPAAPGSGMFVELSPKEKALVDGERRFSDSTRFLAGMFKDAQSYDPETYSRNVKASIATRIPVGMMVQDPEVRDEAWRQKMTLDQLDTLEKVGPKLRSWLQIPGRMAAVWDDLPALMALESLVEQETHDRETTLPGRGFWNATAMSESGRIWTTVLFTGKMTDEQRSRLAVLDAEMAKNANKGDGSWDKMLYGAGTMAGQRLPQFSRGAYRGLQYGALAALAAGVLGNMGPQAAFPEEIVTIPGAFGLMARTGFGLGVMEEGFSVEAGLALQEYLGIKDEDGNPLPEEYARIGAFLYGAGASFLESLQMGRIIKAFPGGAAFLSKQAVAEMLKTKTVQTALKDAIKGYGKDLTFEVATEGAQRLWQIIVGEQLKDSAYAERVAQSIRSGVPWSDLPVGEQVQNIAKYSSMPLADIVSDVGVEMWEALHTFALGMMPGQGLSFYADARAAREARKNVDFFKAIGDATAGSKTLKRLPEALGEYATELTKNGPVAEIGIDAKGFSETLMQIGADPEEVAGTLGIAPEDLREAAATGGDVWLPTGVYMEKIAGTELNQALLPDLRLGEGAMTAREGKAFEEERLNRLHEDSEAARKYLEESGTETSDVDYAKSVVKTQLEGLGIKWLGKNEAESYSTLFAAYAVQAASRWNTTVKEWVDRLNLTIRDNADGTKSLVAEPKTPAATPAQPAIDADGVSAEGGRVVPLGNLRPSETINPERLAAAKDRLEKAKRGEGPKREPLTVWDRGDGTYSIADGNHTYTALNEAGALSVPVKVEPVRNRAVTNIDTLYAEATKAEPEFNSLMGELQSQLGGELLMRPEMKTAESVNRKTADDYDGDYGRVVDVLGGSLVFDTEEELLRAVEALKGDNRIVRVKDKWNAPTDLGYRDYLLNVRLPGGYVGELQVHHRLVLEIKNGIGHDLYKAYTLLKKQGQDEIAESVREISNFLYKNALETGQSAPAALSASSLEALRAISNHLSNVSDDSLASVALGKILKALGPLVPSSAGSHLPSGPVSTANAISSSALTKNSNVLTDTTSEKIIPDNSAQSNGIVSEVVTGEGTTVQTRFRVVDAGELIASNTESFAVNKKYPKELQPRKRDRAAGISQVEKILSGLDPERLGESRMASDGAPIVGEDMVVESGNGRTIALKLMYKRGAATKKARSKYISWLKENAGRFGLIVNDIEGIQSPVLVRVRETDVDRAQFAKEANVASVAAMSASETARADAERMSEKILGTFRPESDLLAPENRPFVREFLSKVVPPNEWGTVTTSAGTLSRQGVVRLQNALAARAYGDHQVLERMAESEDDNIKNVNKGLIQAAPVLAVMEDRIQAGLLKAEYSIAGAVSQAVNQLSILRERGETVQEFLSQVNMFEEVGISDDVKRVLSILEKHKRAPSRIASFLAGYARLVDAQGSPDQAVLFEEQPPTAMELMDAADKNTELTLYQDGAALDAEYLAAVEAGDMETAQGMVDEAAAEAGFVVQHVFHGSKRIDRLGNELKPERATSGPMPFFTDDPTIAENYSQNKADTSIEIPESYNGWFKVDLGRGKPKTIDQAWLYLSLDKRRELAQKLPHVVNTDQDGGNNGEFVLSPDRYGMTDKSHWDHVIREKRGNVLEAAVEIWLDSGELFDQEEKFIDILKTAGLDGVVYDSPWLEQPGVVEAHLAIRTPFDTSNISDDDFAALEAASKGKRGSTNIVDEWDKRRFSGKEWIALLEQDRTDGTSFAWTSIPDWVSRELQRMGYDGIKDQGGKYTGEGHTVWIPFFPWQVKRADGITTDDQGNVIPLSQRFDVETKDIRYQGAYHGTPYRGIEKFSLQKIGTGEGNQAFAWGLYFASKKEIAEGYRETLTEKQPTSIVVDGRFLSTVFAQSSMRKDTVFRAKVFAALNQSDGDIDKAKEILEGQLARQSEYGAVKTEVADRYKNAIVFIESLRGQKIVVERPGPGQLYEVEIPEDDVLLDWDKPFAKQHKNVKLILRNSGVWKEFRENKSDFSTPTDTRVDSGRGYYRYLVNKTGSPQKASEYLFSLGIKGVRYFDALSRVKGKGTHNYVIWDEDAIDIQRTFYQKSNRGLQYPPQGFITRSGGGIEITLTPRANRSTFLHELGHLFLWDLESLVKAKKADPRTAGDWDVVKAWWSGHAQELAEWIVKHGTVSEDVRALFAAPDGAGIVRAALAGKEADAVLDDAVRVAAEEYWARGFEQYLFEGVAPSRALRHVFDKFKRWLAKVYKALKGAPDVELSDEVRAVMDRLLASDEEVDQARSLRESERMRNRLIQQGIPTVEADALREAADKAASEAKTKLLAVLLQELGAETREQARKRREAAEPGIREAMRGESAAWKAYDDLLQFADTGYNLAPDERYGEANARLTSPEGTVPMEAAADLLGLGGVEELQALLAEEARNPFEAELNARLDAEVRDLENKASDRETMQTLAEEMLSGEARLRLLALEQAILARKIGDLQFGPEQMEDQPSAWETTAQQARQMSAQVRAYREVAEQLIADKRVRDARAASRYLAAARKAGREAYELALKGKFEESLAAKDREMMSTALYQASLAARDEMEKAEKHLKKYWGGRKRLRAVIGEEHFAQVMGLTERYGFNGEDELSGDRPHLGEWVAAANAQIGADPNNQGAELPVAKWLITDDYKDRKMSWKDLTVTEFRELVEAVEAIDYFGRSRNKLLAAEREADFAKAKADLEASVTAVHGTLKETPLDPDYRGAGVIGRYLASSDRVEHILRRLDGFKDMAVAWLTFFDPVVKAERAEMKRMREAKSRLETIFSVYSSEERGEMTKKKYTLQQLDPSTGKPLVLSRENVIALLLNWGALENREEVVFGYGFDRTVWNSGKGWIHYGSDEEYWAAFRMGSAEVEKLFSQVLEEKDYEVAQAVWDLNESYWGDIAAMSKRVTGVTPKKVKHLPVTSASGVTYRGGYLTLDFRPESNWNNFVVSEKETSKALYAPQGSRAHTKSGHTKERHHGERGKRLLRLDLGVETEHLRDAIHDLYFRPVIRDLNKLLADPQVQRTIIGSIGMEAFKQFQPWVNGLANAYRTPSNYGEQVMQKVMGRTSAAILGWSLSSAAKQVFGWFPAVQVLGYRRTALAAFNFWRNPFQWGEMRDFAFEKSEYLRDRVRSFDRDVKAAMEAVTASPVRGRWSAVQETFFLFAGWMDMAVSLPVWTAAWDKGMLEFNGDEAKALEYADFVVRSTQNTGAAKDLAAIQQGSPAWKSMTMFYTAFGSMFQQTREQWFRGHGVRDIPRLAAFALTMYVLPALLEDLMSGRGPEEDEPDDILRWALNSTLQYGASQLILVRDVVNAASSGFSYRLSPMASAGTAAAKVMTDLLKTAEWALGGDEPDWEKVPGHLVEISGPAFGLPSNQIMRTMKAVGRYLDNDPDWSPWDFVITPPKKKGRR
jgi:hypothetical protein